MSRRSPAKLKTDNLRLWSSAIFKMNPSPPLPRVECQSSKLHFPFFPLLSRRQRRRQGVQSCCRPAFRKKKLCCCFSLFFLSYYHLGIIKRSETVHSWTRETFKSNKPCIIHSHLSVVHLYLSKELPPPKLTR